MLLYYAIISQDISHRRLPLLFLLALVGGVGMVAMDPESMPLAFGLFVLIEALDIVSGRIILAINNLGNDTEELPEEESIENKTTP